MPSVLVIKDACHLREYVCHALKRAGYKVRKAADGAQGVLAYQQAPADLVVCDLFMPEQDGLGTLRELRLLNPAVKLLVVSGCGRYLPESFLQMARLMGANTLVKPFRLNALMEAVRRALKG